jgi:membrane protein implicated in regulation of membrane protease activity
MKPSDTPQGASLIFAGAAALLLSIAALCAFPFGAYLAAVFFAALGLISLAFARPAPRPIPACARGSRRLR